MIKEQRRDFAPALRPAAELQLSENSRQVLQKRYLRRGLDGKPVEDIEGMFRRVARAVAAPDEPHGYDVQSTEDSFYALLTSLRFFPNSPTFTGAGTPLGQLAACFTENMRVSWEGGAKRISDLRPGDRVLTHEGRYRPVTEVFQRAYDGELLRIKVKLIGTTLEVTPEHPILTTQGWVKAGQLKVGDQVAIGVPTGERPGATFDLAALAYSDEIKVEIAEETIRARRPSSYQNSGRQAVWAHRFVDLSPDLARLCGYYVSEGIIGPEEQYIRFTFGADEEAYAQDVVDVMQRLFGVAVSRSLSNFGNWQNLNFYSRPVTAWFSQYFGRHSYGKFIPVWLQYASPEAQRSFLIGAMRGDGLYFEKSYIVKGRRTPKVFRSLRLTLSNPGLILQVWQMCLRLGYDAAIRPVDTTYVTPEARDTAQISMPPLQTRELIEAAFGKTVPEPDARYIRNTVLREDGRVYFQIEAIESQSFTGTVYNCEVDEDHSYVAEGVVAHNCFVLPISDDMGRNSDGIFQTLRDAALIQQTGGGNGFSFSRLRPKGDAVASSAGVATGPVGFLRVYDVAFGEVAQGGCLTPDTLVSTGKGLLRLDEIVRQDQPGWQPHTLQVASNDGWRGSPRGYNNGVARTVRLHTREGLSLRGTPEHRVQVMSDAGPVWRRLEELQRGDWVMVRLGQHRGQLQVLRQPERKHGNQEMPSLPTILDEELAFFLGYLAGDGFVAKALDDHRVGVAIAHSSYLMVEMPQLLRRLFGVTVHAQQKPDDASVTLVMDNRAVKEFLLLNGLGKGRSRDAAVPRLIRQSPPPIVGAFLRGLFEADGTLTHGYPGLSSTSHRLIEEVSALLIGLGCPVRIRSVSPGVSHFGQNAVYHLTVRSSVGLAAWRERIGCDRRSRLAEAYIWESDLQRESSYRIPNPAYWLQPVLDEITLPQVDRRGRGTGVKMRSSLPGVRRGLLRYLRNDRQFTRSAFDQLAQRYPELAAQARDLADWWFVQVAGVEPAGESLTLDLEVDDTHAYLANGMVTHNTRRGANMAVLRVDHPDIEEFITCKAQEGQITNFNISVGITDKFMQAVEADGDFELVNPRNGKIWRKVRARELFDKIVTYAHHNGEPGALFLDASNRSNPVPHLYELEATNPCVPGGTLVATPNGWRRADSIKVGDEICTVLGTGRVGEIESHPYEAVYAVHLSDGSVVQATASHQFHVRDSHTKFFTPKRLDEIEPGQWVRVFRSVVPDNQVPEPSGSLTQREFGFLVGVLVGDGCYTEHALSKNVVRLSSHADDEEWNAVLAAAFERVGATKAYSYVNSGSRSMMIDPKPGRVVAGWVRSLSLAPARAPEKCLPLEYINSNLEFLTGLLDGLFSTDGSVDLQSNHPILRFHTASPELARQLRLILLMLGVHGRIAKSARKRHDIDGRVVRFDRPKYDVIISGQSLGVFRDAISLSHPAKQARLDEAALRSNLTGGNWAARVLAIEPAGIETVYDLFEAKSDTWITEGYVSRGCGEQWLGPYENCCLGSVNLAQHIAGDDQVDWEKLRESVVVATRFLDNVVDANKYVPAVPQLREAALRARRIGLGIMGLGDLMYALGVRYGSEEGQEFAAQVMEFVRYHCMLTSIELAKERGPFLAIEGSIYDPKDLKWQPPTPLAPYQHDWRRPAVDWQQVVDGILKHGIRNAAQTTVAPTGTIGTVAGCEGYGCEPVFALAYTRTVKDQGRDLKLTYTSPLFGQALERIGLDQEARDRISAQVTVTGSCQDVMDVPEALRRVFVVSSDITAEEHVRMQAAIQAFVDNSISKTVNFPETATVDDVKQAYMLGWELGCKGLTVYVTGSRQEVVLETKATAEAKNKDAAGAKAPEEAPRQQEVLTVIQAPTAAPADFPMLKRRPRPNALRGITYRKETPLGTAYVTVNINGGDQPFEVFMNVGKAGSDVAAVSEALGRLISLTLRLPSPLDANDRLREVMDQLAGIGGGRSLGFGANRVRSLPDAVAQVLREHLATYAGGAEEPEAVDEAPAQPYVEQLPLPITDRPIGDLCPDCGQATFVPTEGCRKCYACGYSEC